MAVDRTYFHKTYLDLYWGMIAERMRIYYRRQEGLAPPWTLDPILRSEFITNMYRELDPGTEYLIDNILAFSEEKPEDKLLNVFIYRLMGSRESTHIAIGFQRCAEYNAREVRRILKEQDAPFGEAYRTASYVDMGSKDKITNVSRLFAKLAEDVPVLWQAISNALKLEDVYIVLEGVKGFGDFLAYQIMVDLLYPAPEQPLVPFTQNDWAKAGPGARRGAWKLMKPGMKPGSILDVMRWLHEHQRSEFERLGIEMLWMKDDEGNDVELSLCNIQSTLCEFFKYTRIWDGTLKYARKYNPGVPLNGTLTEPPLTFTRPLGMDETPDAVAPEAASEALPAVLEPIDDTVAEPEPAPAFLPVQTGEIPTSGETIELKFTSSKKVVELHIKFE